MPGEPFPCSVDGGGQGCAPGWRCGLEGYCHDEDAGAPYLCATSADCEQAWVCGFEGKCVPPGQDPVLTAFDGSFVVAPVSPLGLPAFPTAIALSPLETFSTSSGEGSVQTMTLWDGRTLTEIDRVGTVGTPSTEEYFIGRVDLPVPPLALASSIAVSLVLGEVLGDAGVGAYVDVNGTMTLVGAFPAPGATRLQVVPFPSSPGDGVAVAFSPGSGNLTAELVGLADGGFGAVPLSAPALPEGPIDFVTLAPDGCGPQLVVSGEDGGLYAAGISSAPTSWSGWALDPGAGERVKRIRARGNLLAYEAVDANGNSTLSLLTSVGRDSGVADCTGVAFVPLLPAPGQAPCGCEAGDRVADFHVEDPPGYDVRCIQASDGAQYSVGASVMQGPLSVSCQRFIPGADSLWSEPAAVWQTGSPGLAGYAGSHGELWAGPSQLESERLAFLVPDQPPDVLLGHGPHLLAYVADEGVFYGSDEVLSALLPGLVGTGVGLQRFITAQSGAQGAVAASVDEDYAWGVLNDGVVVELAPSSEATPDAGITMQLVALPDPSQAYFLAPPFLAHLTPLGGSQVVTVSSDDSIYSADVTANVDGTAMVPATLELKTIPSVRSAITSLVVQPGDGGSLDVYALTTVGLFHVTGNPGDPQWTAQSIPIPPGPWLSVWATPQSTVRLGYADGRIFSISAGVQLGDAYSGGEVQAYAQFCGDTYGLSAQGPLRWVPNAQGTAGSWTVLPWDGGVPAGVGGAPGFVPGRLLVSRAIDAGEISELYVATRYGAVERITGAGTGCR